MELSLNQVRDGTMLILAILIPNGIIGIESVVYKGRSHLKFSKTDDRLELLDRSRLSSNLKKLLYSIKSLSLTKK